MRGAAALAVGALVASTAAGGLLVTQWSARGAGSVPQCSGSSFGHSGGTGLSAEQGAVVGAIVATARRLGIRPRGWTIALQTAMQESTLRADVVVGQAAGAFQQIAPGPDNAYHGYDRTNAAAAASGFFAVLVKRAPDYADDSRPNHELAQLVQASGAGAAAYAKHQAWAESVTAAGGVCPAQQISGPVAVLVRGNVVELPHEAGVRGSVVAASARVAKVIGAALAWLGTPYAWGGGDTNGPTRGTRDNGVADQHGDYRKVGFDCSGLTLYAYAQVGIRLTRPAEAQLTGAAVVVPFGRARPGDLLFWGTHHVALYLGVVNSAHLMVEAPSSGDVVKVSRVRTGGDFRGVAARSAP